MAQRKTTVSYFWKNRSVAASIIIGVASYASLAPAQTVVIGGSGASPVQVNLGAINSQPTTINPYNNPYQGNVLAPQSDSQYATGSRIVYGNEVITLTPPGSRPKKKKVITATKKPSKPMAKAKIIAKTVKPEPTVKPAVEVKVAKVAPPLKEEAPKVKPVPAPVKPTPSKVEKAPVPAPTTKVAKTAPAVPTKPEIAAEKPVKVAANTETAATTSEKPMDKIEAPKTVVPVKSSKTEKKPEAELQVASIAPKTETGPLKGNTNQIFFKPEQSKLPGTATTTLKKLAEMIKSSNERIQLIAYADANSSSAARRLSLGRALVVRSKLMELGVPNNKIEVRALGKPKDGSPPDRVDLNMITR